MPIRRVPDQTVVTEGTTTATLGGSGTSILGTPGSTGGGSANWILAAPVPGKDKTIISTNNTTVANTVITTTASITFDGNKNKLSFAQTTQASAVTLKALTSTRWMILASTGVTLSSTS